MQKPYLERQVRHNLRRVVGLHGVPVVEVLPLKDAQLHGEGHQRRHHGPEHAEYHDEEYHGHVVEGLAGVVANVPVEEAEDGAHEDVGGEADLEVQ